MMAIQKHIDFEVPGFGEFATGPAAEPGYLSTVLTDGPVALIRFDESGGVVAADHLVQHTGVYEPNDGTAWTGGTFGETGPLAFDANRAANFDGVTGGVVFDGPLLPTTAAAAFTLSLWFRTASRSRLFSQALNGLSVGDFELFLAAHNGRLVARVHDGSGVLFSSTLTACDDDRWHHAAVVREDDGTIRVYLDGEDDTGTQAVTTLAIADQPALVGRRVNGTLHFAGPLDELAVFHHPLNPARIAAHHRAALGRLEGA